MGRLNFSTETIRLQSVAIRLLLALLLCLPAGIAKAQQPIDAVEFAGLKRSKQAALLKHINSKAHQSLDSATVATDVQTLLNLRIFSEVHYDLVDRNDSVILVFTCNEIITQFPIFSFGTIGSNSFYRAGFVDANVAGKLGFLRAYYLLYGRHSLYYEHEIPYLNWSNYGIKLELKKVSTLEPINFNNEPILYNYDNYFAGVNAFYEFRWQHRMYLGAAYFTEKFEVRDSSMLPMASEHDIMVREGSKFMFKAKHTIANINFNGCLVQGYANETYAGLTYSNDYPLFYQFYNVTRFYATNRLGGNLAVRFKAGISSNNVGPFSPFALDSYLNIRGVGNKVDRGTAQIVLNTEYRQRVLQGKWLTMQAVLFNDMGVWRHSGNTFNDFLLNENFKLYSGLGIRLFSPKVYNLVLRADYGLNLMDLPSSGIVVGIGQYF